MNYKMLDHSYENTGGNCMVSVFSLYDLDKNRTLFAIVSEDGGSLSTVDYVMRDIDFENYMLIDTFSLESLDMTNDNFQLYRYCINEYAKKDCKHFGHKMSLPYEILSSDLQQQLTPEYIAWHEENVGSYYYTDGYKMHLDINYQPPVAQPSKDAALLQSLKDFRAAFYSLNELLSSDDIEVYSDNYPFESSFDELTVAVSNWCDTMVDGITGGDEYVVAAKNMIQAMDAAMDKWQAKDDEEAMEEFYNIPISITFGNTEFALQNSAAIYNAVLDCCKQFIDNY